MPKIRIAQKLGIYAKELGMGIEPLPEWRYHPKSDILCQFSILKRVIVEVA
jgi:hypothetical protein